MKNAAAAPTTTTTTTTTPTSSDHHVPNTQSDSQFPKLQCHSVDQRKTQSPHQKKKKKTKNWISKEKKISKNKTQVSNGTGTHF